MSTNDLWALLPFIILAVSAVAVMLTIAFYRSHQVTLVLTLAGLACAVVSFAGVPDQPRSITPLIVMDGYALFFIGLILLAAFCVALLSYGYLEMQGAHPEEFYLLLLLATLGTAVLAASTHFASFFLGIEILSVSLYALAAYQRHNDRSIEAGVKYLILAAVSSAFILFGMALLYAEIGSMEFGLLAGRAGVPETHGFAVTAGFIMIIVGVGFKLAVVPFHLWTPDVYEGAPAPVTAFIATVSKGAVFALVLRFFIRVDLNAYPALLLIMTVIAVASMFAGNLLALLQNNVKRILAYSSISHIGYLLVTLLASGPLKVTAGAFYLTAYFIMTLGAFGVVTVLSRKNEDADRIGDYAGLAWKKPWVAAAFTAMLLSLAGIPLTAGFIGKFYLAAAGVGSSLWMLVIVLVINSAIGLFYYLRLVVAVYSSAQATATGPLSFSGSFVLAGLTVLLIGIGVYPAPLLALIEKMTRSFM